MTREEEIKCIAKDYANSATHHPDVNNGIVIGFKKGAQWADEHPKSPWISVEERLPEMHEFKERDYTILHSDDILLASSHCVHFGCVWFEKGRYTFGDGKEAIKEDKWTHWMPIPELKKGE